MALAKKGHSMTLIAPNHDPTFDKMPNVELYATGLGMDATIVSEDIFEGKRDWNMNKFVQFELNVRAIELSKFKIDFCIMDE